MTKDEILATVLSIADRENDAELTIQLPNFIKIVDSYLNRKLNTSHQEIRTVLKMTTDNYYAFPEELLSIESCYIVSATGTETECKFISNSKQVLADYQYSIVANSIKINTIADSSISLIYRRGFSLEIENFVSKLYPDLYIFGLLAEVYGFLKNDKLSLLYYKRLETILQEIQRSDVVRKTAQTILTTRD